MGDIHDLLTHRGLETSQLTASSKLEKQCLSAAARIMSDDELRMGITHAGFAMTSLPHKPISEHVWTRSNGSLTLHIESGRDKNQKFVGIPSGATARLILLYLQTRAIETNSRVVDIGASMDEFLKRIGKGTGGEDYRLVKKQSDLISRCKLTFLYENDEVNGVRNAAFVDEAISFLAARPGQRSLWEPTVTLNELFFNSLKNHAVPLLESALRELSNNSAAIDIYIWLAYRLHVLDGPLDVSWPALYAQFGGGYKRLRSFRAKFIDQLALAMAVYPDAQVSTNERGVRLYPSNPPIAKKFVAVGGSQKLLAKS